MKTTDLKRLIEKQGFQPLSETKEGKLAGGFIALADEVPANNCNCDYLTNNCLCKGNNCDCPPTPVNPNCLCNSDNCDCYLTNAVPVKTSEAAKTTEASSMTSITLMGLW